MNSKILKFNCQFLNFIFHNNKILFIILNFMKVISQELMKLSNNLAN